jgi:hypothetical protein
LMCMSSFFLPVASDLSQMPWWSMKDLFRISPMAETYSWWGCAVEDGDHEAWKMVRGSGFGIISLLCRREAEVMGTRTHGEDIPSWHATTICASPTRGRPHLLLKNPWRIWFFPCSVDDGGPFSSSIGERLWRRWWLALADTVFVWRVLSRKFLGQLSPHCVLGNFHQDLL